MSKSFNKIGIFAKTADPLTAECTDNLIELLIQYKKEVLVENESSVNLANQERLAKVSKDKIGAECDLIIVVGGDGSILNAARSVVLNDTPILGIHRGRLGFLADISPQELEKELQNILDGKYVTETRSMLHIDSNALKGDSHTALNDVVLYNGDIARMIEFEVYIDGKFVLNQRSDGMIVTTPTGSTAYALSGGGPIVYPSLKAITLVPMFAHTLSARPIVVHENSVIKLFLLEHNNAPARISCDGQVHFAIKPGESIEIRHNKKDLNLIHPENYDYFSVLREKLGWNLNATSDRYPPKSFSK